MHVAHLLRKYDPAEWGGTETAICQLVEGLGRHGVKSTVYCPAVAAPAGPDPLTAAGAVVRRFNAMVPAWGISPELRRQMIAVGGNLLSFELPRLLWRDRDATVIHTHTLGRIGGIGLTLARRKKLPLVVTVHGGVYDLPEPLRQSFDATARRGVEWGKPFGLLFRSRRVLHEADAILTCNPREAALIRERHPERRVLVQPHGVPAKAFAVDQRSAALDAFPVLRDREVILSLGRIDAVKNQSWVVAQLPEVLARHRNAMLVLAGACTDEAYGGRLRDQIERLGLGDRVLVAGKLPPADPRLVGLLQVARVAILSSVSETFGLVILEAWAAGTPALSSRTSGASTLIAHGRNGWLFDLDAPATFHAVLDAGFRDEAARTQVIAAGRERVTAEFDTRVLASRILRLYEGLVEEKYAARHSP